MTLEHIIRLTIPVPEFQPGEMYEFQWNTNSQLIWVRKDGVIPALDRYDAHGVLNLQILRSDKPWVRIHWLKRELSPETVKILRRVFKK